MRDFSLLMYSKICNELINADYGFQTVEQYVMRPLPKVVLLRHDVDSWPINALQMARVEAKMGIVATYYFRKSCLSFNELIIKEIVSLGHEIGYHYEDLSNHHGKNESAIVTFRNNLEFFRNYYPVKTIAMHGRPLSRWDSKDLWKKYDYREFDLIAEPYLDIDFTQVAYLTDTGNCWDGDKFSVRDHVKSPLKFEIHDSIELMDHVKHNKLPNQIMLNIHPARWNNNLFKWLVRYYVLTLPKYQAKKWLKRIRDK